MKALCLLCIIIFIVGIHSTSLVRKSAKINVFSKGENGYFCIKIPDLILTLNGTLIAFGEGRMESCSDYAWTDLVYKRSVDNGTTWSSLKILRTNSTKTDSNVIGNAAPIQCNVTKRILVPHCRNNREVWLIYSDNDGITWSSPIGPFNDLVKSDWSWIGLGPPAGLQLKSNNRIIIPCYHSIVHLDGDLTKGHIIYSDDYGVTWNLSDGIFGYGPNNDLYTYYPSESQAIEFSNGSLLINSRGTSKYRVGSISSDFGNTFEESFYFNNLLDETTGCEGSMIKHPISSYLYYSGLTPSHETVLRYNMSVHISKNHGNSWQYIDIVDYWSSAYSALISLPNDGDNNKKDKIGILYENAEFVRVVFIPDYISYQTITVDVS